MSDNSATSCRVHTVAERIRILGLEKFAEELRKKREVESILSILKRLPTDCSQEFKNTVSVRISKKLEEYREACRGRTGIALCVADFDEELDDLMSKNYYRWSRDSKEVVECNFCSARLDIDANKKYRTTQAIFDLGGACVECQPKLLDGVQTCIHPFIRGEIQGREYTPDSSRDSKCLWCYDCGNPKFLSRLFKVDQEEMISVIDVFKKAWELKKFKGELTVTLFAKDLNSLSLVEFAEKYGLSLIEFAGEIRL
jgi:hypothetical protein